MLFRCVERFGGVLGVLWFRTGVLGVWISWSCLSSLVCEDLLAGTAIAGWPVAYCLVRFWGAAVAAFPINRVSGCARFLLPRQVCVNPSTIHRNPGPTRAPGVTSIYAYIGYGCRVFGFLYSSFFLLLFINLFDSYQNKNALDSNRFNLVLLNT